MKLQVALPHILMLAGAILLGLMVGSSIYSASKSLFIQTAEKAGASGTVFSPDFNTEYNEIGAEYNETPYLIVELSVNPTTVTLNNPVNIVCSIYSSDTITQAVLYIDGNEVNSVSGGTTATLTYIATVSSPGTHEVNCYAKNSANKEVMETKYFYVEESNYPSPIEESNYPSPIPPPPPGPEPGPIEINIYVRPFHVSKSSNVQLLIKSNQYVYLTRLQVYDISQDSSGELIYDIALQELVLPGTGLFVDIPSCEASDIQNTLHCTSEDLSSYIPHYAKAVLTFESPYAGTITKEVLFIRDNEPPVITKIQFPTTVTAGSSATVIVSPGEQIIIPLIAGWQGISMVDIDIVDEKGNLVAHKTYAYRPTNYLEAAYEGNFNLFDFTLRWDDGSNPCPIYDFIQGLLDENESCTSPGYYPQMDLNLEVNNLKPGKYYVRVHVCDSAGFAPNCITYTKWEEINNSKTGDLSFTVIGNECVSNDDCIRKDPIDCNTSPIPECYSCSGTLYAVYEGTCDDGKCVYPIEPTGYECIDEKPPTVRLILAPYRYNVENFENFPYIGLPTAVMCITDEESNITIYVDGSPRKSCNNDTYCRFDINLHSGIHSFECKAVDNYGNVGSDNKELNVYETLYEFNCPSEACFAESCQNFIGSCNYDMVKVVYHTQDGCAYFLNGEFRTAPIGSILKISDTEWYLCDQNTETSNYIYHWTPFYDGEAPTTELNLTLFENNGSILVTCFASDEGGSLPPAIIKIEYGLNDVSICSFSNECNAVINPQVGVDEQVSCVAVDQVGKTSTDTNFFVVYEYENYLEPSSGLVNKRTYGFNYGCKEKAVVEYYYEPGYVTTLGDTSFECVEEVDEETSMGLGIFYWKSLQPNVPPTEQPVLVGIQPEENCSECECLYDPALHYQYCPCDYVCHDESIKLKIVAPEEILQDIELKVDGETVETCYSWEDCYYSCHFEKDTGVLYCEKSPGYHDISILYNDDTLETLLVALCDQPGGPVSGFDKEFCEVCGGVWCEDCLENLVYYRTIEGVDSWMGKCIRGNLKAYNVDNIERILVEEYLTEDQKTTFVITDEASSIPNRQNLGIKGKSIIGPEENACLLLTIDNNWMIIGIDWYSDNLTYGLDYKCSNGLWTALSEDACRELGGYWTGSQCCGDEPGEINPNKVTCLCGFDEETCSCKQCASFPDITAP